MSQETLHLSDTEFGNVCGTMIMIGNRSYFRITDATIVPNGLSISGYAIMTLADWDKIIEVVGHNFTLGKWSDELELTDPQT